jgi:plastocyanin
MNRRTFLAQLAGASATTAGVATLGNARAQGSTHTVGMYTEGGAYYFDPIGLHVKPGDTVEWVLKSGGHSSTSYTSNNPNYDGPRLIPKNAKPWDSGVLDNPGASFSYTFNVQGTYNYYCIPHKTLGMVGRIVCGEPGGPGEQKQIPSSDRPEGVLPPSDVILQKGTVGFPYVPKTGHGGPPVLFWGGMTAFTVVSIYLFGVYDRQTGRYSESPNEELDLGMGRDTETKTGEDD